MTPSISVVVPAFNEAMRLAGSLHVVLDYLERYDGDAELIVVDDGSTDRTADVAADVFGRGERTHTKLIRYSANRGKGYAVRTGLLAARAPVALFTDADLSTPITEVPKLVDAIERGGCDLVLAWCNPIEGGRRLPTLRVVRVGEGGASLEP